MEQPHVKAAVYIDNVQRRVTRKPKEKERKKKQKTYNHMLSSVRDLMIIYNDGELHENVLKGYQIIR